MKGNRIHNNLNIKRLYYVMSFVITIGSFLSAGLFQTDSYSPVSSATFMGSHGGPAVLRPRALAEDDESDITRWRQEWTTGQISYHLAIVRDSQDIQAVASAIEAIETLSREFWYRGGDLVLVAPPGDAARVFVVRFESTRDAQARAILIRALVGLGLHIPEIKELAYGVLADWAAQPEVAKAAMGRVMTQRLDLALGDNRAEVARFADMLFPLVSQDSPEPLMEKTLAAIGMQLQAPEFYEAVGREPPSATASFLDTLRPFLREERWMGRFRALSGHENPAIRDMSASIQQYLTNPDHHPFLSAFRDPQQLAIGKLIAKKRGPRRGLLSSLSEAAMAELAEQVKTSPLPRGLLEQYFTEGNRKVVFIDNSTLSRNPCVLGILQDALYLRQRGALTHFAILLPPAQEANFQRFLDGEESPEFLSDLDAAMGWFTISQGEDPEENFDGLKTLFRSYAVQLQQAGVRFVLFDAGPRLSGELIIDKRVANLRRILGRDRGARILVYVTSSSVASRSNLHTSDGVEEQSCAKALSEAGVRVASIIEEGPDAWQLAFFDRVHNLEDFIDRFPPFRSFGLSFGGNPMDTLRFYEGHVETYQQAWDGMIFRFSRDDEGGGDDYAPTGLPEGGIEMDFPLLEPPAARQTGRVGVGTLPAEKATQVRTLTTTMGAHLTAVKNLLTQI